MPFGLDVEPIGTGGFHEFSGPCNSKNVTRAIVSHITAQKIDASVHGKFDYLSSAHVAGLDLAGWQPPG
ncbi:hypothetical protein N7453_012341 [Penicillium expansum]|nr:hypothetical protein N7453_012341 [Penicillium expansum]